MTIALEQLVGALKAARPRSPSPSSKPDTIRVHVIENGAIDRGVRLMSCPARASTSGQSPRWMMHLMPSAKPTSSSSIATRRRSPVSRY